MEPSFLYATTVDRGTVNASNVGGAIFPIRHHPTPTTHHPPGPENTE
ncbi:MAG: hypothetical protein IKH22_06390 [Prevotella sp.]|nr:hypothetical protein [Prevotella sp.]